MAVDHYARSGERWAHGASLVYAPIAAELVARCPHPVGGRTVLDAGAGTGVASAVLLARGAGVVAADFSHSMLAWDAPLRPPATVADICALPLADGSVDDTVAAFVLNHLTDPERGLAEISRVTRRGGAVLACVYSTRSRSEARDLIDEAATQRGWEVPDWYVEMKASFVPLLGSERGMAAKAAASGLLDVLVDERPVDVGITTPEQLVDYRFGQAHFADWLDAIGVARAAEVKREVVDTVRHVMRPYRPVVVFLSAVAPGR